MVESPHAGRSLADVIQLGRFQLDRSRGELTAADGTQAPLRRQALLVLLALAERPGHVVDKDELIERVWPGKVVTEDSLVQTVADIRRLLGRPAASLLRTVPRRGYLIEVIDPAAGDPSHLVGRENDLANLRTLLLRHRMVTLLGPGGVGKTRLARTLVGPLIDTGMAVWIDLASLSSGGQVVPSIARAANLRLDDGNAAERMVQALGRRDLLLLLDNCEHVAEDVATTVHAVLAGAPRIRVLATSQVGLGVDGETSYRLPPLDLPPVGATLESARCSASIQLLEQRARVADHRFGIDASTIAPAIELVHQLDGLPLSIEMAAARLPLLGFAGMVDRLGERLRLLRSASSGAPSRQQTLRATLEWSHGLLDLDEQAVLRRLSVFAGTFSLDMAQYTVGGGDLDEWRALDALDGLVAKSILAREALEPPRYRLLESTRLFARENLSAAGEVDLTTRRHGEALARCAEQALAHDVPDAAWLARYRADYDDFAAAFDRACERGDANVAGSTVAALRRLDQMLGSQSNSSPRVERACALLPHAAPLARVRLAEFIASCGWFDAIGLSRLAAARLHVELWQQLGNPRELHDALARLGTEEARAGNHVAAEHSIALARGLETPELPSVCKARRAIHDAWIGALRGDAVRCRESAQEGMALARQFGATALMILAGNMAANACQQSGQTEACISICRSLLKGHEFATTQRQRARSHVTLCEALLSLGDVDAAHAALAGARQVLTGADIGEWLDVASLLAARMGRMPIAGRLLGAAESWHLSHEDVWHHWGPPPRVLAAQAIEAVHGPAQMARWRVVGSQLGSAEIEAQLDELLLHPPAKQTHR